MAIAITSLVFVVFHLNQAWALPVLFHLFALSALMGILAYAAGSLIPIIVAHVVLDVFNFAYWWSDVAGSFEMRPLAETGIDAHFVVWSLVFGASLALLVWTLYKTNVARQRSAD